MGIENKVTNKEELLQSFVSLNEDINERLEETNELCEDGPDLTPNSNAIYYTPPSGHNNEVEMEEDVVLGASRRLRTAVDRILKLLSEIVSTQHEHDFSSVAKKNEELLSELNEECVRRNKLTAQLLQIEDRVKSLEKEKTSLSDKLIDYNEMKRQLETTRAKMNEYELERDKWLNDNKRLQDEKCSFAQGLPQLQKISINSTDISAQNTALFANTELVDDNESLNSDVLQLQQERIKLLQRIHTLTLESETLRSERDDILDDKRRECEDFVAQIEANEKNILSYRKFIDEQTHERELERDEYHKELVALTERIKDKEKSESKLRSRLEEMETQISCLTEEKCFKEKQLNDCNHQLKSANNEIIELKAIIKQMERESDKSNQSEKNLRSKIDGLNEALELQIRINEESQNDMLANNILEQITSKTHILQNTLGSAEGDSESEDTSIECSYTDVGLLSDKLNALNECIDKLLLQNNGLKKEVELIRSEKNKDFDELVKEKQSIERNLTEIQRSNEILKEALNTKHLQLSSLKSRLELTLDSSEMKHMFEELQNKLISEEQKNKKYDFELISLKQLMDDKNNKTLQLLDELNALKRQFKTIDSEKCSLIRENDELRLKLSSKDAILVAIKQQIDDKNDKTSQLFDELNALKRQFKAIDSEKCSLVRENGELRISLNSKDSILVAIKQQIDDKNSKTSQLLDELNALKRQFKTIDSEKCSLVRENGELRINLSSKDSILVAIKQQIEDKNKKISQLLDELNALKRQLKTIESEKCSLIRINEESQNDMLANNILEQITSKTHILQNTLGSAEGDSESEDTSIECSYTDVGLLSDKLNALNECIDKLLLQNNGLKKEVELIRSEKNKDFDELVKEKQSIERNLTEIQRSNEILKEALNTKHLQLSSLKSRLELTLDSSEMKHMFEELQNKLISEEQKNKKYDFELISLKQLMDDKNNKTLQLLDELNALKRQFKTIDSEKCSLIRENDELRLKLSSKDAILVAIKQQIDDKNDKTSQLFDELDALKRQFKAIDSEKCSLVRENGELRISLSSKDSILVAIKQQIDDKNSKTSQLLDELNALKRQFKTIDSEKCSLVRENGELRINLSSKDSILVAIKQQIEDKNKKISQLLDELNALKRQLKTIESEKCSLVRENDELRLKLSSKDAILVAIKQKADEKGTEEEERLNGVSSQLLWKLKRVISHKNALIHQKKYLLHVLGGFQLTERATLALLANMNVTVDDELPAFQSSRNRFRSAVYCVIAISRMKLLVRKWKSRNHSKSRPNVAKAVSASSLGTTNELQTDSTLQEFVNRLQRLHDTLGLRTGQI
ncbi:unnamed protein product [Oppiella nova]|uniref:Pericentrin/AKAP-450 centrosomal targeting domain-containing protein n=1 Tax=Oppiella nova TaxID=334625 RepID=A0A7R9LU35_9ACAR|nr:unnamed protein product [Oppiella nova]CAG2166970.1 unnamed protein product [Oppiella nova]